MKPKTKKRTDTESWRIYHQKSMANRRPQSSEQESGEIEYEEDFEIPEDSSESDSEKSQGEGALYHKNLRVYGHRNVTNVIMQDEIDKASFSCSAASSSESSEDTTSK